MFKFRFDSFYTSDHHNDRLLISDIPLPAIAANCPLRTPSAAIIDMMQLEFDDYTVGPEYKWKHIGLMRV